MNDKPTKPGDKVSFANAQRKSVLIVEDEPAAREASELYLSYVGFDVATAANASEAMDKAATHAPDVVVCDWRLGGGADGAQVARDLQQRHHAAIIFVTAHPLEELRNATKDLNVSRYMRKPLQLSILADAINDSSAEE
jgi:DNA-binding response OmpR family regulator